MGANSVNCTLKSDIDQTITLIERDGIGVVNTSATVGNSPLGEIAKTIQLRAGVSTSLRIGLGKLRQTNQAVNRHPKAEMSSPETLTDRADKAASRAMNDKKCFMLFML
jgi:hypothetical protein